MARYPSLSVVVVLAMQFPAATGACDRAAAGPTRLTLYAGSRGTGVPAQALERLHEVRRLLDRQEEALRSGRLRYTQSTVGLEGEQRLCIELRAGPDGAGLAERIRTLVSGTPMLSLSEAPCPPSPGDPRRRGPQ